MQADNSKIDAASFHEVDDVKDPERSNLKLDARGVPLVPQPSDHKDDPLVRPYNVDYRRIDESKICLPPATELVSALQILRVVPAMFACICRPV